MIVYVWLLMAALYDCTTGLTWRLRPEGVSFAQAFVGAHLVVGALHALCFLWECTWDGESSCYDWAPDMCGLGFHQQDDEDYGGGWSG